jgi:hypothetical protein
MGFKICVFEELFPKIIPYSFYVYTPNARYFIAFNDGEDISEDTEIPGYRYCLLT